VVIISCTSSPSSSSVVAGKMDTGEYIFINQSSHTITLIDGTTSLNLEPGEQRISRFTSSHSVNEVKYEPTASVYPSTSGNTITFRDR
jgi:hypothetical protein